MKTARILSLRRAEAPRHGVVLYGVAQSVSRPQKVNHTITARKRGRKLSFSCTCETFTFRRPKNGCRHIRAFKLKLRKAR